MTIHWGILTNIAPSGAERGIVFAALDPNSGAFNIDITVFRPGAAPVTTSTPADANGYLDSGPLVQGADPDLLVRVQSPAELSVIAGQRAGESQTLVTFPRETVGVGRKFRIPASRRANKVLLLGNTAATPVTVDVVPASDPAGSVSVTVDPESASRVAVPWDDTSVEVRATGGIVVQLGIRRGNEVDQTVILPEAL